MKNSAKIIFATLLISVFLSASAFSMVKGDCVNCHTMHNSQDGSSFSTRDDAAFAPGTTGGAVSSLLRNTCIGCHSSTGSQTIVPLGETRIPIVYNVAKPIQPLAGGNFYWVDSLGDNHGHNVRVQDEFLSKAPGVNRCGSGGNNAAGSCHASLSNISFPQGASPTLGNGCVGCHDPAHHANDETNLLSGDAKLVGAAGGGYRFINQAGANFVNVGGHRPPAMVGIEDPNWEQQPSSTAHNEYQDSTNNSGQHGMSEFCTGCHGGYHALQANGTVVEGEVSSPWLRHPAGIELPADGEYAGYTEYDPQVPIARADATALASLTGPSSTVTPGQDKVMCLSCHRVHGSEFGDMLRWDYNDMRANTEGSAAGSGCFKCHTLKDGVDI